MVPVQLGVGIPFGCQIGAKGAQCAFDFRKAVSTWDGNSALNTETRQDSFSGVFDHRPSPLTVLCMGLWTANATKIQEWYRDRVPDEELTAQKGFLRISNTDRAVQPMYLYDPEKNDRNLHDHYMV